METAGEAFDNYKMDAKVSLEANIFALKAGSDILIPHAIMEARPVAGTLFAKLP